MKLNIVITLCILLLSCEGEKSFNEVGSMKEEIKESTDLNMDESISVEVDSSTYIEDIDSFDLFVKSFSKMNNLDLNYYHFLNEEIPTNNNFFEIYTSNTKPIHLNKVDVYFYSKIVFGVCSDSYLVIFNNNDVFINKKQISNECDFDLSQPQHHSQTYKVIDSNKIEITQTRYYFDSLVLKNIDFIDWEYSEEIFFLDTLEIGRDGSLVYKNPMLH